MTEATIRQVVIGGVAAALAFVVGGCASSDRMSRMSGGIIHEYSAPASYRLRAEKFQAKSGALESAAHAAHGELGGIDDAPVNLWPFFFKSRHYTSVLWPLADIDAYGFAVRPFLNVEGDDQSVLFPLSAWNVADGDGWALNFVWEQDAFGFVPLTWQSRSDKELCCYYLPFYYHRRSDWRKANLFPLFCYEWDDTGTRSCDLLLGLLFDFERSVIWRDRLTGVEGERVSGGSFPFFHRTTGPDGDAWFSLVGLSAAQHQKDGGWTAVVPPIGWMSKWDSSDRLRRKIYGRDRKWAAENDYSVSSDTWGLCGLYYHGCDRFSVAKEGVDAQLAEQVRVDIGKCREERYALCRDRTGWHEKMRKVEALEPKEGDKIAYYRKMLRLEEMRLGGKELSLREEVHSNNVARLVGDAAKLGLAFDGSEIESQAAADAVLARLFDTCTELREREDFGCGFIFRKESFYNGDFKWRLLGGVAGSEKDGARENTHVLHLLYRARKDGEKSETVFFPFVTVARDGDDRRFSFLGRIFQRTIRAGRTSGYFFFIPFGEE